MYTRSTTILEEADAKKSTWTTLDLVLLLLYSECTRILENVYNLKDTKYKRIEREMEREGVHSYVNKRVTLAFRFGIEKVAPL